MSKTCTRCKQDKPLSAFSKQRTGKDGIRAECKSCAAQHAKAYYARNPVAFQARWLRRKYNLTADQRAAMGSRCAICGSEQSLCIDHDHQCCSGPGSCGQCVRSLLCDTCNMLIGKFEANPGWLAEAVNYLTRWKAKF
jgi:hypothetical protein